MNSQTPTPASASSVLQHSFSLGELLDLGSFREICTSYAELFQIGFKIFDQQNERLVDVKGANVEYCTYMFGFPKTKSRCMREVAAIRQLIIEPGEIAEHNCFTGLRYTVAPICHEGTVIGKIVYGPYLPIDAELPSLVSPSEKFNMQIAGNLLRKVRKVQNEVARKVIGNLVQSVEVML